MNLQGLGALMFGTLALAFIAALSITSGGPDARTVALLAVLFAYLAQLCFFYSELLHLSLVARCGTALWIACLVAAAASAFTSIWS
jgi:hypothetical protein